MKLLVNGKAHELSGERPTVRDLVRSLGLADAPVAVEVNRQVVPRRHHDDTALTEGDAVEVVTLVGGG